MAAYHLIGQDAVVQISTSTTAATGQSMVFGSAVITLTGDMRNCAIRERLATVDVAGVGDTRESIRAKRGGTEVSLEKFTLSTGADYQGKLGYYGKIEIKELSTMTAFKSWAGIITEWEWSYGDDAQAERITITCDAETA